jgi:ribonuclease J
MVSIVLDRKNRLAADPEVRAIGLPGDDDYPLEDALEDLADEVEGAIKAIHGDARDDDRAYEQAIGRSLKRASQKIWERRPVVETVVVRLR